MTLLISRVLLTAVAVGFIYFVWTKNADLVGWATTMIESKVPVAPTKLEAQKFELFIDLGLDPLEKRVFVQNEGPWEKARIRYRFLVRSTTKDWYDEGVVGIIFWSGDRLYNTESQLPKWVADQISLSSPPEYHRLLHHTKQLGKIQSAQLARSDWAEASVSINHTPWKAAVYVLAEDTDPVWFQLTVDRSQSLSPQAGQGVQVRELELAKTKKPEVAAGGIRLIQ